MKKGIRSDQNNRKIMTSKKFYDCVATELPDGRMMELYKAEVKLQIFSDNGYIKTVTEYKCPYCNNKDKTDDHNKKQEGEKVVIEVICRKCKTSLISETLTKNEL